MNACSCDVLFRAASFDVHCHCTRTISRAINCNTTTVCRQGGTVLGSSRGGFDAAGIVSQCLKKGVNQIYVIGGDGSHRAAEKIHKEVVARSYKMVVACVPKTIDNDIGIIDRSFGFNTAVEHAVVAIRSAVVEARAIPNGVGR
jgi:6-phosphofructokinase 1